MSLLVRVPSNHFTKFINTGGQRSNFIYILFIYIFQVSSKPPLTTPLMRNHFRGFVLVGKPGFRVAPFRRSLNPGGREPSTVSFFRQISDTIPNERYEPPANPSNRAWIGAVSKLTATRWDWPLQTPRVS